MGKYVKLNLKGLDKMSRLVDRGTATSGSGPIDDMFKRWGKRYLAFTKRRYVKMSKGGWAPLAESTKKSKTRRRRSRSAKGPRKFSVLRDTGVLFKALDIGAPGNLFKRIRSGIRVGFGGPSQHPDGYATIADIATFHQEGKGNLPKREIIVAPDGNVKRGMQSDLNRALRKIIKQSAIK